MKAKISEIFYSIQGEGVYAGVPQVFVRFAGCNINCVYCDTDTSEYEELTVDQVIDRIASFPFKHHSVSMTGGEPLAQHVFLGELCRMLKERGDIVFLETNGTMYEELETIIEWVDIISMDVKLDSVAKAGHLIDEHLRFLKIARDKKISVKAVLSSDADIVEFEKMVAVVSSVSPDITLVIQPVYSGKFEPEKLCPFYSMAAEELKDVRIMPQIHKITGIR